MNDWKTKQGTTIRVEMTDRGDYRYSVETQYAWGGGIAPTEEEAHEYGLKLSEFLTTVKSGGRSERLEGKG